MFPLRDNIPSRTFPFVNFAIIAANAAALAGTGHLGGVAWWAHIGGFIGGVILLGLFLRKGKSRRGSSRN